MYIFRVHVLSIQERMQAMCLNTFPRIAYQRQFGLVIWHPNYEGMHMYSMGLFYIPRIWLGPAAMSIALPGPAAMSIALPIASFLSKRSHGLLRVTPACCVST